MLTNTDITVYRRNFNSETRLDTWEREYVHAAWWFVDEKSSVDADGMHRADAYKIRIPDLNVLIRKEDYIVKGDCQLEIETPKELMQLEHCKVMSVNYNRFGSNPHIKVGGQ